MELNKLPAKATTILSLSSELRFSKQGYCASLSLVLSFDLKLENLGTGMNLSSESKINASLYQNPKINLRPVRLI